MEMEKQMGKMAARSTARTACDDKSQILRSVCSSSALIPPPCFPHLDRPHRPTRQQVKYWIVIRPNFVVDRACFPNIVLPVYMLQIQGSRLASARSRLRCRTQSRSYHG